MIVLAIHLTLLTQHCPSRDEETWGLQSSSFELDKFSSNHFHCEMMYSNNVMRYENSLMQNLGCNNAKEGTHYMHDLISWF